MNEDLTNKAVAFFLALGAKDIADRDVAWQGIALLFAKFTQDNDAEFVKTAFERIKRIAAEK